MVDPPRSVVRPFPVGAGAYSIASPNAVGQCGYPSQLMREPPWRPTLAQLQAARGRTLPDVWAPGLRVLFCGVNPSLYSAAVGHHFARPGNRFWPALHGAGFTRRLLSPFEDRLLLGWGLGCTNLVERATARAAELRPE